MSIRIFNRAIFGIVFAGLFCASSAGAQDDAADDQQDEDLNLIEEVIVTANKREQNVQDIGLSIQAFNADQLAAAGVNDVRRLNFLVAGLTYSDVGRDAKFALRGANSTNTFQDNASIIGAYVDGVYKQAASQQTRAFFDVERLEFLKGPQGTLYGRNTFAGALNVYTNKPHTEGFDGSVEIRYSRFNTLKTESFINVPVNDTFALRLAGYTENGDGYLENNAGPNGGAPNNLGVRFSARWEPNDDVELIFRYSYVEETGTVSGLFGNQLLCRNVDEQGITDAFGAFEDCQNPRRGTFAEPRGDVGEWNISRDWLPPDDMFETMAVLEINWDAGPVLLKSITSWTDFENNIRYDGDDSPTPVDYGGNDDYVESITQEIVLSSNNDGAFQWIAGAYYAKDEAFYSFWIYSVAVPSQTRPVVDTEFGPYVIFNGTPLVSSELNLNNPYSEAHWVDTTAKAVFAQGELTVADNVRLIAGIRYNDEDKEMPCGGHNYQANGPITQLYISGPSTDYPPPQTREEAFAFDEHASGCNITSRNYDNTSWKASIEWDLSDDRMLYATAATGFLSGALNFNGNITDEQESEMWEVGFKSILMDGTLQFNMAAHWTEYTNLVAQLQTTFIDPDTGLNIVSTTSRNGGDIEAKGLEFEVQYLPTREWTLGLNAAFLDAEFGEFGQTPPYQLNRGVPTTFQDMNGETPGWSPDLVVNFSADYAYQLDSGATLTPGFLFLYSDSYNTSNLYALDPNHHQDSYTKADARLTWLSASGDFRVAGFINNISNEAVLSRGNGGSQQNVTNGYLYPRNYGVEFQVRF